jgi:YqaJ-like viral recombinase domain
VTLIERVISPRRTFIGGSDARIIMGDDKEALLRLWREKRGEAEAPDLSSNLIVQLGVVTEDLNRRWYQANTGQVLTDIGRHIRHPILRWMAATLDGRVGTIEAVFEAKFMLPWAFSEEAAAEKHMAQLQHNMWVVAARSAVLSVITGGGKWVEITTHADPLRGGPDCRYERLQFLGGICCSIPDYPASLSRARAVQSRAQGFDAGGCQRGSRPRGQGQALQVRCSQL